MGLRSPSAPSCSTRRSRRCLSCSQAPRIRRGIALDEDGQRSSVVLVSSSMTTKALPARARAWARASLVALALTAFVTSFGWVFGLDMLAETDVVLLYLVGITVAAARFGRAASVATAALSVAAFDVFFIPPFFTFAVHDSRHVLTFAMMFVVGLFVSAVAARLRDQERDARAREQ